MLRRLAGGCGVDSTAQDMDRWRAVVNEVISFWVLARGVG
jgi:hypothetical protein